MGTVPDLLRSLPQLCPEPPLNLIVPRTRKGKPGTTCAACPRESDHTATAGIPACPESRMPMPPSADEVMDVFKKLNNGADGYLSPVEFANVMRLLDKGSLGDKQLLQIKEAIGTNEDGHIHVDQLINWCFGGEVHDASTPKVDAC